MKGGHDEMKEIVENELWETIARRGALGNLFMGVVSLSLSISSPLLPDPLQIPMVFYGYLNLLAYVAELVWIMVGRPNFGKSSKMGKRGKSVKFE